MKAGRLVEAILGKNVSHTFIRVKDDQDKAVLELHGVYSNGLGAIFNTAAKATTGCSAHLSHLHVLALTSDRLMRIFTAHSPVTNTTEIVGSKDDILRAAECMVRAAERINKDDPDYFFNLRGGGQTCNSVSAELLRRAGIDLESQKLPYAMPGKETNLETIAPALKGITVDRIAPLTDIEKRTYKEIADISPDLKGGALPWLGSVCTRPAGNSTAASVGVLAH